MIQQEQQHLDVISQIPPNPRAVLFIAHEGNGSPLTYWEPQPQQPNCTGVPDHVAIVKHALSRGYAVIAIKSVKSFWQDWPPQASQDAHNVVSVLVSWTAQHGLERAPIVGLGSGSGGNFLSMLALTIKFSALVLMVSPGLHKALERAKMAPASTYPPVLFVHMPKDQTTASKIHSHEQLLRAKAIPVAQVCCEEFPIAPFYFAAHIPGFGSDASTKLHAAMQAEGVIDGLGRVLSAPRPPDVCLMLEKFDVLPLQRDDHSYARLLAEHIHSLMRVAQGRHATTGRKCPEIFNWLDNQVWGHPLLPNFPHPKPPPIATSQHRLPFSKFHHGN
ncbi:uncharacterized protein LOC9654235 [Selaginella moellendorffii]|uniref:uncharacterized protein LOC9654235 n=1 Tax=Selaginella moellendorffii TaxID=88036 RepID=UPI000D1CCA66|nr:uncharacterized protein LOC9654235 [Selaginella moellendorffii]|eukprot:XP_002963923.2 uncharacterized protein LOC9654235 [Selaginella moellendorffii]